MYIAMNRFKIVPGREQDFETVWRERDSQLNEVPGFQSFHLLRGASHEDHTLYSSHTVWQSEEDFTRWTHSEAFQKAHRGAGRMGDVYLGHPQFEGFEAVLSLQG